MDFAKTRLGATTTTVSEPVLLLSLLSLIFPFGSTVAVFARLPAAVGVTLKLTVKLPLVPIVTDPPLAEQVSVPLLMAQLTFALPVMLIKFPAEGTP